MASCTHQATPSFAVRSLSPPPLQRPRVLPTLIGLNVWICAHVAALVMFREQFPILSWCTYAIALAFFHLSEFIWAALCVLRGVVCDCR